MSASNRVAPTNRAREGWNAPPKSFQPSGGFQPVEPKGWNAEPQDAAGRSTRSTPSTGGKGGLSRLGECPPSRAGARLGTPTPHGRGGTPAAASRRWWA